jgi:hypothetical protein
MNQHLAAQLVNGMWPSQMCMLGSSDDFSIAVLHGTMNPTAQSPGYELLTLGTQQPCMTASTVEANVFCYQSAPWPEALQQHLVQEDQSSKFSKYWVGPFTSCSTQRLPLPGIAAQHSLRHDWGRN